MGLDASGPHPAACMNGQLACCMTLRGHDALKKRDTAAVHMGLTQRNTENCKNNCHCVKKNIARCMSLCLALIFLGILSHLPFFLILFVNIAWLLLSSIFALLPCRSLEY